MTRFIVGGAIVAAFIALLVLADFVTANLSRWIGTVIS